MNSSEADKQQPDGTEVPLGLPLKIAGIVFWGLVVVGIIIMTGTLRTLERESANQQRVLASQAVFAIQAITSNNPDVALTQLAPLFRDVIRPLRIPGVIIESGMDSVTIGTANKDDTTFSAALQTRANNPRSGGQDLLVTIFQQPLENVVNNRKKQYIILMGLLFFAFGVILQWILQKVLTRPFMQMVKTAESCSRGKNTRFDESRPDEFGYLSRFINKAMATLHDRQQELSRALSRAKVSERALYEEKVRAEVTLNSIAEGVITTDREGHVRFMNPVAERLSGWEQTDAAGKHIDEIVRLIDEQTTERHESVAVESIRSNEIRRSSPGRILLRRDDREIAVEETAAPMHDSAGSTVGAVLVFDDIREKKALTEKLTYQASHDTLTGLFNRAEFDRRVAHALTSIAEDNGKFALCYMDLDQFKLVNDTCGHVAGDELLRQLGQLLHVELRESDIVARLGGDEFGILLQGCSSQDAQKLVEKLHQTILDYSFVWEGKIFQVGVSMGIVPLSESTESVSEALAAADVACYAAKESGRGQVHTYEPNDKDLQQRRQEMQWVGRIRQALKEDRLQLYLQPIVPVMQRSNFNAHAEILLRMLDEQGNLVTPGKFLDAAEQYGLMPAIDEWVLQRAFLWLNDTIRSGQSVHVLGINISGQSLSSRPFLSKVVDLLHELDTPPEKICFEITETFAIANFEVALKFMRLLKGMGCQFAIDDFGSGMSSFSYLKQLPFDFLKIDGSYVRDLLRNPVDRAMVEAVNQIGHAMGIQTIAEFVEDDATLGALANIGVDYAQGYAVGRPQPVWPTRNDSGTVITFSRPPAGS